MPFNFDAILGSHEKALYLGARRTEILAANLANADTPNYKARDIDFKAALNQAKGVPGQMRVTHALHIQTSGSNSAGNTKDLSEIMYRVPLQSSLDGNTVNVQLEQAKFAENAMHYQATLKILGGRLKGLVGALKGE